MTKTPVRTIRVDDELWDAARAEAEKRGMTMTDAVREALTAWLKPVLVVVLALVALLGLTACGGDEPAAAPSTTPTASSTVSDEEARAIVKASDDAAREARQQAKAERLRAVKGECESVLYKTPHAMAMQDAFLAWGMIQDAAERAAKAPTILAMIPSDSEACSESDVNTFQTFRETLQLAIG